MSKKQEEQDDEASQNSESTSDSHLCCCLCYCAVDYSDREAFYGYQDDDDTDDEEEEKPRLLPKHVHDAQNALVLCDSCDRPYHQRCHFVPIIALPRGDWHCLLCIPPQHEGTKRQRQQRQSLDTVYPFPPKDQDGTVLVDTTRQDEWEYDSRHSKAVAWKRELARLQRALSLQLQTIRLAQDTIRSHTTSTSRKSHCMTNPLKSQELCQCVVRLTTAKLRIRQWFQSLEKVRRSWDGDWSAMQHFVQQYPEETKTWFPYGQDLERRIIPRCGHSSSDGTNDEVMDSGVPTQVIVANATNTKNGDDDDDMISLDDLQCCVCFRGDASDENDVLLCDGQGCFRALHMKCVVPHVTPQEVENEDDDWFCPICTAMAKLLANVQSEYTGDEWQVEDDASTIRSWDHANDVFPEAEQEYEMAIKWKEGQHDDEMAEFMSNLLGIAIEAGGDSNTGGDSQEEEDDDDSQDEDFDLDTFKNRKRNDDEESDVSSKATLQDMSDVEAKIDRKELDALSLPSEDSSDEDEESQGARRRTRSARSSCVNSANNSSDDESSSSNRPDVGTLDESNIVVGKRRRNQVDYRRLNDSMFGDMSEGEAASIDDKDEFEAKIPSRRNSSSSDGTSSGEDDDDSSSKGDTSESESDTNESSVDENQRAKQASKNKTTVDESDSDSSKANANAKRRATRGKSKKTSGKKDTRKRQASTKRSAVNESDSDSSNAKANRRTTRGKSKQGKKDATESPVEKKRTKRASKKKATVNESDSDSSDAKANRRTARGKSKKGKSGAKSIVARKRNATKQDVSSESSSDESNPKGIANNNASRKSKTPITNGERLVNGQKKRRPKRAKWES